MHGARLLLAIGLAALCSFACAGISQAETPKSNVYVIKKANRRPVAAVGQNRSAGKQVSSKQTQDRALTRAADQQRIEEISPVDWLRNYGPVRVSRNAD